MFGKSKETSHDIAYLGLRNQALATTPSDIGLSLENNEQVYTAVVDIPISKEKIVSLVCFFDGTVSLYYSTGGGLLGIGQKHESVRQAGGSFLYSAGQALKYLKKTSQYDLPDGDLAFVFLLTGDGVYKAEFNMSKIDKYEKPIQFLNFLIQNILCKIRENTTA